MGEFQEPVTDKLIEKLAKMQKLAERGGTPEEAANAARMVQKFMLEHGLTLAEIAMAHGDELKGYGHQPFTPDGKVTTWKPILLNTIALGCMCRLILLDERSGKVDIIGHKDQVDTVIKLFESITPILYHLCELRYKLYKLECKQDGSKYDGLPMFRRSYMNGAIQAIREKFAEEKAVQREQHSKALIVIEDKTKEVMQKLYPRTRQGRARGVGSNREAFNQGKVDGRSVQVRPGISRRQERIG